MSYDISVGDWSGNYTYNVSALFYDHMPGEDDTERGGLNTIHGMKGKKAGWGSTVGALIFLAEIMAACYRNPKSRVVVS